MRDYSRGEACQLAGISLRRFATLDHRQQLPIDAGAKYSRVRHTAADVLLLAVGVRLADKIGLDHGLSPETACSILGARGDVLRAAKSRGADWWFGYASEPIELDVPDGGFGVAGSLPDVVGSLEQEGRRPLRVALINVSAVLNEIGLRAMKHGIAWSEGDINV